MLIVCDSSTLISLSSINHLWILKKLSDRVILPEKVYEEVVIAGSGKPGAIEIGKAAWLERKTATNLNYVKRLCKVLNPGESEAIALAKELKADLVLLDDELARKIARNEKFKVSGLLALLVKAKEEQLIPSVKPILNELRVKGFYLSKTLYDRILEDSKEKL